MVFNCDKTERPNLTVPAVSSKQCWPLECSHNENTTARVPASIAQYLRPYQKDGVLFMYERFMGNKGCFLADDMGLGKTVQVIAFLSAVLKKTGKETDMKRFELRELLLSIDTMAPADDGEEYLENFDPVLIIAPASVMHNWCNELDTWGYFAYRKFHGNERDEALRLARNRKLDIVLTTYETARDQIEKLNSITWYCVIADEVHKIKEPESGVTKALKSLNCRRRIGLTGTLMQNSLEELFCVLDWANPGCLGTLKEFKAEFANVIEGGRQQNLSKEELVKSKETRDRLNRKLDKWVLRRQKAVIAEQLPKKEDLVVFCSPSECQIKAYQSLMKQKDMKLVKSQFDPCACGSGKINKLCCLKVGYLKGTLIASTNKNLRNVKCT